MDRASQTRPVRLLAAGGTISMRGRRAVPALDGAGLIAAIGHRLKDADLRQETVMALPSAQLTLEHAHQLAGRAAEVAGGGEGVVITTGTDTMEEIAVLCSFLHGGQAPIVLTGANRPDTAPGADGLANLIDAIAVAASAHADGLGAVVVFGGEIHGGMTVAKVDSTGPAAFGSPVAGPIGRVVDGRVWLHARPVRPAPLVPQTPARRVEIVTAALGDDGAMVRAAAGAADGLVLVALGAGHLPPPVLGELRAAVERVAVVITCRPARTSMLFDTYGFEGAERDLRHSGAACAPFLTPAAARIALLCCLGAGLDRDGIATALAPWDAGGIV